MSEKGAKPLTPRQKRFAEEYALCLNKSKAARQAGYSAASAGTMGYELWKNPQVREYAEGLMAELVMSKQEALVRLSQEARNTLEPFISGADGVININLTDEGVLENLHLVKSIKQTRIMVRDPDHPENFIPEIKTELVLHDAQSAKVHILKAHGAFTNKVELSGPEGGPIPFSVQESREKLHRGLDAVAERLASRGAAQAPAGEGVFLSGSKKNGKTNGKHK